ncbi:hypothetical protein JCM10213_003237 [Rhodosporidiobolus nylandii]
MPDPNLSSIPPELLSVICFHLNRRSLASFALTSSRNHAAAVPILYRHFKLPYTLADENGEGERFEGEKQQEQKKVIKAALESLAQNPERCKLLRIVEAWNWGQWFDVETAKNFKAVLDQAQEIQDVRLLQDANFESPDESLNANENMNDHVWPAVKALPALSRLRIQHGLNVALELDEFKGLKEVDLAYVEIGPACGWLPISGLEKLRLEAVSAFEEEDVANGWFAPEVFFHLESLTLVDLAPAAVHAIMKALEHFREMATNLRPDLTRHSRLEALSLDFHTIPLAVETSSVSELSVATLLTAFSLLESIELLTIGSTPDPTQYDTSAVFNPAAPPTHATLQRSAGEPLSLLFTIAHCYAHKLEGLAFYLGGDGDALIGITDASLLKHIALMHQLKRLIFFQTNLVFLPDDFPFPAYTESPAAVPGTPYTRIKFEGISHRRKTKRYRPLVEFAGALFSQALPPLGGLPIALGGEGGLMGLMIGSRGQKNRRRGWHGMWSDETLEHFAEADLDRGDESEQVVEEESEEESEEEIDETEDADEDADAEAEADEAGGAN